VFTLFGIKIRAVLAGAVLAAGALPTYGQSVGGDTLWIAV